MMKLCLLAFGAMAFSCTSPDTTVEVNTTAYTVDSVRDSGTTYHIEADSTYQPLDTSAFVNTGKTEPEELVAFAQTLKNIPYKYGSVDPGQGFDCSGFVTYVFNHFGIEVPRSSVGFDAPSARTIPLNRARPGDLILFTGTDSTKRVVGHMGIIISDANKGLSFIHSTSGKAYGVTETPLNPYYQGRFMRAIRIFKQNDY